jgi:hypothetical protein
MAHKHYDSFLRTDRAVVVVSLVIIALNAMMLTSETMGESSSTCTEMEKTTIKKAGAKEKNPNGAEWERLLKTWIATTAASDEGATPLHQARNWLASTSKDLEKRQLDFVINNLLEEEEQSGMTSKNDDDSLPSLRRIEWHVVLLLQLWILNGDSFIHRFAKIFRRRQRVKKNKKKKKQLSSIPSPKQILLDNLVQELSRAAFLLPRNEPFGTFLRKNCLTKQTWKQQPDVVSYLMDYFEVSNPYLPKEEEKDLPKPVVKKPKKKTQPAAQTKKPLRRLPTKRNSFRGSHFHGKLQDMSKLLEQTPKIALGKKSRPLITPHSTKITTQTKKNHNVTKKRPRCVEETPFSPKRIQQETPSRRGIVEETPVKIVGETPAVKGERLLFSPEAPPQPLKLFAALKPRAPKAPSPKKKSKSSIRPARVAVAAARAYLHRKSL